MISDVGTPLNITATAVITAPTRPCLLIGFYVNSTTGGTLVLAKSSGGTAISGTITPAIGYHPFPADCPDGLHATIANALNVTFFIQYDH